MNSVARLQNINKNCIQPVAVNENEDLSEVWLGACVFAYACACECVSVWVCEPTSVRVCSRVCLVECVYAMIEITCAFACLCYCAHNVSE